MLYDRDTEDRAAIAKRIVAERGATLVPPYDDPLIIAGQGTIGAEIVEDLDRLGLKPEIVVVGASGGGLAAGISLGVKSRVPAAKFYTVEPEGFDDTLRSFKSGRREANPRHERHHLRRADEQHAGRTDVSDHSRADRRGRHRQRRGGRPPRCATRSRN